MNKPAVTADDVDLSVRCAAEMLRLAPEDSWDRPAGTLAWTCWETVEHIADDLFAYAVQMGPSKPALDGPVPFVCEPRRDGGPASTIFVEADAGPDGLIQGLEACGALLSAMVRTAPPGLRAHHGLGNADPGGFAAMGVIEVLVHAHDLAEGLALEWNPQAELCSRVLARLFPDAPTDTAPWPTLLWATGRAELPGHGRLEHWRWYAAPEGER